MTPDSLKKAINIAVMQKYGALSEEANALQKLYVTEKAFMNWQPMDTAPQDQLFVGIYGPINPPLWRDYSFFYAIGNGLYKCKEVSSVTFPSEHCKIFAWIEIPKYEGWSQKLWTLYPEIESSSDVEDRVKAIEGMLTSLKKRLQKP